MTASWDDYAELAQRLDSERATEAARTAGLRAGVAEMTTHADQLEERLTGQQSALSKLGTALRVRLRKGAFSPLAPAEGFDDPAPGLRDIAQDIDETDRLAREAEQRGTEPALLPRWPEMLRSWVVYGVAAILVLISQIVIFYRASSPRTQDTVVKGTTKAASDATATPNPNAFVVLILVPLIFFAIAYVVASVGFRPRIEQGKVHLHARLGVFLCFGIGPFAVILLLIHNTLSG